MNQTAFRLVFTNKNAPLNLEYLNDLIEWRNYQSIADYDFIVIKLGHINTLHCVNFDELFSTFSTSPFLLQKPVMFSVFSDLQHDDYVLSEKVTLFNDFVIKMQCISPNFKGSIAWTFDFLNNQTVEINKIPTKASHINYNLYLHHYNGDIDKALSLLTHCSIFNGFDITSYFNNFENPSFDNRSLLLPFFEALKENHSQFLEQLSPEYLATQDNDNTFRHNIEKFCQDGYIIDGNFISPLIYGSFDDFTFNLKPLLSVPDFLLQTLNDITKHYTKMLTKSILSSYCASCDHFSTCQYKLYYWNNIQSNYCSLGIENQNSQ